MCANYLVHAHHEYPGHASYQRQADIRVNTTDPDATLMHKTGGGTGIGCHTHYAVDGGKARIILTVLVTPSEVMDNLPMLEQLWRSRLRWQLSLARVTGDTKYGTAENIVAIEHAGLRAYLPLQDCEHRTPYRILTNKFRQDFARVDTRPT